MKKLFLMIATLFAINAFGQIKIDQYGDVQVGSPTLTPTDQNGNLFMVEDGVENALTFYDGSSTSMRLFRYSNVGYIIRGTTLTAGISIDASGNIGIKKAPTTTYALDVSGAVRGTTWTSSDKRLKTNINKLSFTSTVFDSLIGYSYNYKIKKRLTEVTDIVGSSDETIETIDSRISFGFIAQDVQKYFPDLVMSDDEGILSINYDGFIPVLWESYKEMNKTIISLEERIKVLENSKNSKLKSETDIQNNNEIKGERNILKQNIPNPWNTSTIISLSLNDDVKNALICIYDMNGKQLKCYSIIERGETEIEIYAQELIPGMYMYSLIVDNNLVDTKRMILTE